MNNDNKIHDQAVEKLSDLVSKKKSDKENGAELTKQGTKLEANIYAEPVVRKASDGLAETKVVEKITNTASHKPAQNPNTRNGLNQVTPATRGLNTTRPSLGRSQVPGANPSRPFPTRGANGLGQDMDKGQPSQQPRDNSPIPQSINPLPSVPTGGLNPLNPTNESLRNKNEGNNKNKGKASATADITKKVAKIKKYWPIISVIAPLIGYLVVIVLIVIIVMTPIMYVRDNIEGIKKGFVTGLEKWLNLVQGDGWMTNKKAFFAKLQDEYNRFNSTNTNGAELDIPLIAATIHYSKLLSPEVYEKKELNDKGYGGFNSLYSPVVGEDQTRAFYNVAKDKLGSPNTLWPGQKRLLGHLVKTQITIGCVDADDVLSNWQAVLNLFGQTATDTLHDMYRNTPLASLNPITSVSAFIDNYDLIRDYADDHGGSLAYYDYNARNLIYEAQTFKVDFAEAVESFLNPDNWFCPPRTETYTDENGDEKTRLVLQAPAPSVTRTMDYEGYKDYLRKVYIPATYFYNEDLKKDRETKRNEIEHIIEEIFMQRDFYLYLIGFNQTRFISGGFCAYNIGGDVINDLKVRLLQCVDGNRGEPIPGEELVSFEKYILGVVYAEIGAEAPPEAQKAQAIAARSYALNRPKAMGNAFGLSLKQESSGWILSIRNCTEDQVYCDPDTGCSKTGGVNTTTYSDPDKYNFYKGPLAADSPLRTNVAEVAGKILLDTSGNLIGAGYIDVVQNKWSAMANNGMDYTEILMSHYDNANQIQTNVCTSLVTDTGFSRPTTFGTVTSNYGPRPAPCAGCSAYHNGIDIGIPTGTPVYATAAGTVSRLVVKSSCGGNMVYVNHDVEGEKYTSVYMHLASIAVTEGTIVKKDTIVGYSGGGESYDKCSTGPHLHFGLYSGLEGVDQIQSFDPRTKINFPPERGSYNNRES